jgi:tetratricopeptide (TPR) repeat protein
MRFWCLSMALGCFLWPGFSLASTLDDVNDLHFAEAYFYAQQGRYFDALKRLDMELLQHYGLDEPARDSLYVNLGQAEFAVGDFELNYRMHHRAGRAIQAVLEGDVEEEVRNEAALRLARIHFQKGQMPAALAALERMRVDVSTSQRQDAEYLRANVHLAIGEPQAAADILSQLQSASSFKGFATYNLGIALWRAGEHEKAFAQLTRAGTIKTDLDEQQAIRDKANLVLGSLLMDLEQPVAAVPALNRVRLQGPFANQALLSAGWADVQAGRFERAVVPWNLLAQRDSTQAEVLEAKLALPYAYGQLAVHGRAAVLYSEALNTFGAEVVKLDASIQSIRAGRFLEALVREEVRHDEQWVVRLRELPDAPETYYLTELLASHEFHTGLRNYLDLEDLRKRLMTWQRSFAAYHDLLDARLAYYEPRLPEVDARFRALDSRIRLRRQQSDLVARRLDEQLVMPRPEMLATASEAATNARLMRLSEQLGSPSDAPSQDHSRRIVRLKGLLTFQVRTTYHERLTELHTHVAELKESFEQLDQNYSAYVRLRQAAEHSFTGFHRPFNGLARSVDGTLLKIEALMSQQGTLLERVAIEQLQARRERLLDYQNTARFAMADSYDRATKTLQAGGQ